MKTTLLACTPIELFRAAFTPTALRENLAALLLTSPTASPPSPPPVPQPEPPKEPDEMVYPYWTWFLPNPCVPVQRSR
ncbi:MAG: hypothetical protein JO295_10830 [Verrucomicrobia bacterium]|nr:hypothetical protein [Verrucomicrobiota bacterium]